MLPRCQDNVLEKESRSMTDLENMSAIELKELARRATELAESKKDQERRDLRAELVERIRAVGYAVDDIFPGSGSVKPPAASKSKAPAKYRHPENPTLTWSGRGRKPRWLVDAEASGQTADEFLIQQG